MYHVGSFITTKNRNNYVLVLIDNFTKFVILYAVTNTEFVEAYGLPRKTITDRGTCYISGNFKVYC